MGWLPLRASRILVSQFLIVGIAAIALAACARMPAAAPHIPRKAVVTGQSRIPQAPADRSKCRIEGCCPGRGETAYLQSDWYVICADGLPSDICDCH